MGRPRMIIIVRHAQSEGNRNRSIHQVVPDHRVKLTSEGWTQAEEAGQRLRDMLRPDDTLQFYTSPYRRTRETTEGMLRTLTAGASPFPRHTIRVWEEPRIREQDFGNFQPCSSAMQRMWQERADYGHFFYRIPNGESAADAYDRVSGFNESLWRSFEEDDFASVCVLVTHGLMSRVFLMKWYHWSVEYFEDLRNVNHCEFVIMKRSLDNGKYILQNDLRTWSELKKRMAAEKEEKSVAPTSPEPPRKRWGGCADGCAHESENQQYPKRPRRGNSIEPATKVSAEPPKDGSPEIQRPPRPRSEEDEEAFPYLQQSVKDAHLPVPQRPTEMSNASSNLRPTWLEAGRDFGGSTSGMATPTEEVGESGKSGLSRGASDHNGMAAPSLQDESHRGHRLHPQNVSQNTEIKWIRESGMGTGARADALGDQLEDSDDQESNDLLEKEKKDRSLEDSVY